MGGLGYARGYGGHAWGFEYAKGYARRWGGGIKRAIGLTGSPGGEHFSRGENIKQGVQSLHLPAG